MPPQKLVCSSFSDVNNNNIHNSKNSVTNNDLLMNSKYQIETQDSNQTKLKYNRKFRNKRQKNDQTRNTENMHRSKNISNQEEFLDNLVIEVKPTGKNSTKRKVTVPEKIKQPQENKVIVIITFPESNRINVSCYFTRYYRRHRLTIKYKYCSSI